MARYQVVVGNVGTVYDGDDRQESRMKFTGYRSMSKGDYGRASGESVYLMDDGEIVLEFVGREDIND